MSADETVEHVSAAARLVAYGDAVMCGKRPLGLVRTVADEARETGDTLVEAAACAVAMVCIQDARETYVGLAELQRRVLGSPTDQWAADPASDDVEKQRVCLAWACLGRAIAGMYASAVEIDVGEAAEDTLRALAAMDQASPALRLTCARYLLGVAEVTASASWFGRLDALAAAAMSSASESDRVARDEWLAERVLVSGYMFLRARIDEATFASCLASGRAVGPRQRFKILRAELFQAISRNDLEREAATLDALRASLLPQELVPWIAYLRARSDYEMRRKEFAAAESLILEALALAQRIEAHALLMSTCYSVLAATQVTQARLADAAVTYDRACALALPGHKSLISGCRDVLRGVDAVDSDLNASIEALQAGLLELRTVASFSFLQFTPQLVARACAHALEHGIEPDYVRNVIARRNLAVPFLHARQWPWQFRVQLFGGFRCDWALEAEGDGKSRNKPARRLLGLLKWLAHVGPEGIDRRTLIRKLWPGEAADEQSSAFDMALGRLRKVLPDADLIVVDKGMIRLDSERVWVDAWAFTSLCDHVGKHISNEPLPNPDVLLAWAGEINRLVVGRYLDGDEDGAAMEVVAEQLRERFVNNQEQLAEALARHDVPAARDLLARALEREPYAEQLYRALMRMQLRAGDFAEVVRTYRRCQTAISRAYGVALASQTQAILAQLPKPT